MKKCSRNFCFTSFNRIRRNYNTEKKKKTIKIMVEVSRFYILQAGNQSNH